MKVLPDLLTTGSDPKQGNSRKYWLTFCPTLVALRNETHARQVCSATPTSYVLGACVLALDVLESSIPYHATAARHSSGTDPKPNTHFACSVPNTKPICCAFGNSKLTRGRNTDLEKKHIMQTPPGKLRAEYGLKQNKNREYWMSVYPALAALRKQARAKQT